MESSRCCWSSPLELAVSDFDYRLPSELIAQQPAEPRDSSRLMVLSPGHSALEHARFCDLPEFLRPGDVVVANRTRVLPARLDGRLPGGGRAEFLLVRRRSTGVWEALGRPGRRLRSGAEVRLANGVRVGVQDAGEDGLRVIAFEGGEEAERIALAHGRVPLPPYIKDFQGDPERYQTVYADAPGSAAAPTAGLHFTPSLLRALGHRGVKMRYLTLHVGLDTFRPVKVEAAAQHTMHAEYYEVPSGLLRSLRVAREQGRRVIAVGTTVVRALESVSDVVLGTVRPVDAETSDASLCGWTRLFILPGYRFRLVDGLVTNFHLPRSTLLMLVSAFAGRERVLDAYQTAIRERYRFYSFGDATLLWKAE